MVCTNCGKLGHGSKQCLHPVTSFGVIMIRFKEDGQQSVPLPTPLHALEFLLIQRRDSLGFVELMRGKYRVADTDYVTQLISSMTQKEVGRLTTLPFDTLWEDLWGPPQEGTHAYRNEKEISRQKFEQLRSAGVLQQLIDRAGGVVARWATPEWGFPKGRRDPYESEFACAMREMWEETGIRESDIIPIQGLEPIQESFKGSNSVDYLHKYFMVFMPSEKEVAVDPTNEHMQREIGDIRWCSLEQAMGLLRPEQAKKRETLLRVHDLLSRYWLVRRGPAS